MLIDVNTDNELYNILREAKLAVVDWYGRDCGPCQQVAPAIHALAETMPGIVFVKCDVEVCAESANAYGIQAMPTFTFFKGGQEIRELRVRGANIMAVKQSCKRLLA